MKNSQIILDIGYKLIKFYLERRRYTVVKALLELRPDLIITEGLQNIFPLSNLEKKVYEFTRKYTNGEIHFAGNWDEIWLYKLHGTGCELRNILTGELFDWDMSDPLVFGKVEFQKHLEWRCLQNKDDEILSFYLKWIKQNDLQSFWDLMDNAKIIKTISLYEATFLYNSHQIT